jgi:hypothetical protein
MKSKNDRRKEQTKEERTKKNEVFENGSSDVAENLALALVLNQNEEETTQP